MVMGVTTIAAACAVAQQRAPAELRFPDVVAVKVRAASAGQFDFDVTVSSPYDTPQRYADGFRVQTLAGQVLGERKLLHDHQNEQPFTRDLYGVKIPPGVSKVLVQARDQQHGYGGAAVEAVLPGR
jgi:hypothetical protein